MKKLNIRQHIMTAISFMIPYVVASGMLMVLGNVMGGEVLGEFTADISVPDMLSSLGATGLGFLPIIISTGIAYSIADRPGIAPGVLLGLLSQVNGYGFLGGLLSGFLVGYLVVYLIKIIKAPEWMEGLVPQLILPLLSTAIVGLLMQYIIGVPIIALTNGITNLLINMQGSSVILLGLTIGVLSAIDYGGPINKTVFVFASGVMTEGVGGPIAVLILASMVAPFGLTIGYWLSKVLNKDIYSDTEVDNLKSAFLMGCAQITEGSFPIILNDLIRITIATGLGAGVGGAMALYFGVSSTVPAGGFFALPGINEPLMWLLSLAMGSLVTAVVVVFTKRKPEEELLQEVEEKDLDLNRIKIS